MAFKIKKSKGKGRPKANYKIRSIRGITPKGFDPNDYEVRGGKIIFKRKK